MTEKKLPASKEEVKLREQVAQLGAQIARLEAAVAPMLQFEALLALAGRRGAAAVDIGLRVTELQALVEVAKEGDRAGVPGGEAATPVAA